MEKNYLDYFKLHKGKDIKVSPAFGWPQIFVQDLINLYKKNDTNKKITTNTNKISSDNFSIKPRITVNTYYDGKLVLPDSIITSGNTRNYYISLNGI